MQVSDSPVTAPESVKEVEKPEAKVEEAAAESSIDESDDSGRNTEDESVVDVSGRNFEFSVDSPEDESVKGVYLYRNVFNLIPKSVGGIMGLRSLKFFGNEIDLFPEELGNLVGLEYLQVKISSPGFGNGLALDKLTGLKELELTKVPRRSSALTILSEIAGLKCLTRLSVCHFSIRYLPPEIGCLRSLEHLDLSFNKIKSLPKEISYLSSLVLLKVAHNKLVELPLGLSSLQNLESLDLSNNRLTSLDSLDLSLMHKLQNLNLQYNKLQSCCQIPAWMCCNFEGNGRDVFNDDSVSSAVEMDVYETSFEENFGSVSYKGSHRNSPSMLNGLSSSNNRCFAGRRSSKRWTRRQHYFQQRARQERLNNSRKWKGEGRVEGLTSKTDGIGKPSNQEVSSPKQSEDCALDIIGLDEDVDDKQIEADSENSVITSEEDKIGTKEGSCSDNCSCDDIESTHKRDGGEPHGINGAGGEDSDSSAEKTKISHKSKRHSDRDLDNPKPCKCQRPTADSSSVSRKYSNTSFCSVEDRLPDGFYDAGRDRPFMPLCSYEKILHIDSREVILLDREKDEELDAITFSARALVSRLKPLNGLAKNGNRVLVDNLQTAQLLALFVSDHFGGSDKSAILEMARKKVSGSNYQKPFVCTCSTGNRENTDISTKQVLNVADDIIFVEVCEKSVRSIKSRRNSIVVPIGTLQFGVCRHRALLMKYLCDRMEPPVPCELVRGYLDFFPHAWNIVPVKRGDSWIRMVVDACHPHDIREESDPEYFCRYIPLSRINASIPARANLEPGCLFPSLSRCDGIETASSTSLVRCKLGSVEAVAKVRRLEVCGASMEEIRNFEHTCLGEVRMLGVLKHSCIVEMYGHQISSKWVTSADGNVEHRVLQSSIMMEYIKGGSLKSHIEKLAKAGEKHVPVELAFSVARDIAGALAELHCKHIIHRDVKSENILIDLDRKRADGTPVVKLCDFDRAVPLRSLLHTCCISHTGIPPPDVCVGTPRWMAPEVLRAMHERNLYGLEVDIWSYGCLIYELLTLQVPYAELPELQIHEALQSGKRPRLPNDLESLGSLDNASAKLCQKLNLPEADIETFKILIEVFYRCTKEAPNDRPTAGDLYNMMQSHTRKSTP